VLRAVTRARVAAGLLAAVIAWASWPSPAAGKGFPLGRDIRVTCDAGARAERSRKQSSGFLNPGDRLRSRPTILACASLPNDAGTVQLSALPHAPFPGCVLDSYTVAPGNGGLLCADFSRVLNALRKVAGLWITRLGPGGPSVALGAATSDVHHLYLWYTLQSGAPGIASTRRITVDRRLARQLGAPPRFTYFAGVLPADVDLCQQTLVGGRAPGGAFGPAALFDTPVTRTEGAGLTETPRSERCTRQKGPTDPVTALMRGLNATLAAFTRAITG